MANTYSKPPIHRCSFCGKNQTQVEKLIAGPDVYICNECVELCNEIMEDELGDTRKKDGKPAAGLDHLPTRQQTKATLRTTSRLQSVLTVCSFLLCVMHTRKSNLKTARHA